MNTDLNTAIEVLQAIKDGKEIEAFDDTLTTPRWIKPTSPLPNFGYFQYRVKKVPQILYVVFNSSGSVFGGWSEPLTAQGYTERSLDARFMKKFAEVAE